jgi:hypothetical protein
MVSAMRASSLPGSGNRRDPAPAMADGAESCAGLLRAAFTVALIDDPRP